MQIIPVIDLMHGQVVHAKLGIRSQYQPIQSPLSDSSEPLAIVASLRKLYPFQTLYIADLDAISGNGHHATIVAQIAQTYPELTIWLDAGIRQADEMHAYQSTQIKPVIGSENIATLQDYLAICDADKNQHILSLDYTKTGPLGINALHETAHYWPENVICMTLHAVGSSNGVDLTRLNTLIKRNATRTKPANIYAAGGVRNMSDIATIAQLGITGALIASALHQQTISQQDLVLLNPS